MSKHLVGRSFLTLLDYSSEEIRYLLDLSHRVKQERATGVHHQRFAGYTLAMLFEKRSTRTRCAFESAFGEEGGHPVFLSTADIQLGAKETIEDTARVLGRMFDVIEYRGFAQRTVELLAEHSGKPVINGLTDAYHPTQALADLMTIEELCGTLAGVSSVYLGDGRNNVSISLMIGAAKMGLKHVVACPPALSPARDVVEKIRALATASGGSLEIVHDVTKLSPAQVVYTDVWASMGEEAKQGERTALLRPFQVNAALMQRLDNPYFLHCLPAVRDQEMTAEVIDGPRSRVWDQAENRKHTIKAIMLACMGLA